jgi:hypothetical protein
MPQYARLARDRARLAIQGQLPVRTMNTPVYDASKAGKSLTTAQWRAPELAAPWSQINLVEERRPAGWDRK